MTMEATFSFQNLKFDRPCRSLFTIDQKVQQERWLNGRARSLQTDHSANQTVTLQRLYSQLCQTDSGLPATGSHGREKFRGSDGSDDEDLTNRFHKIMDDSDSRSSGSLHMEVAAVQQRSRAQTIDVH